MSHFAFGSFGAGGVPGNDSFTTVLLHGDGTNGSTSIVNSAFTTGVTMIGNTGVTNSTTSPKFGSGCLAFNGTGYSQASANSLLVDASTPFTIDLWIKPTSLPAGQTIVGYGNSHFNTYYWQLAIFSGKIAAGLQFASGGGTSVTSSTNGAVASLTDGAWHHLAFVRNGSNFQLFVDGIGGTVTTNATAVGFNGSGVNVFNVGAQVGTDPTQFYTGYMDEIRYSHGAARWTIGSNFTPPTGPYI